VPVAIKDNIATRDIRTTCGSRLFADWVPDRDATVVKRLKDAGAVILGKTGTHELAYGTTSINPFFGAIRNPWDTNRDPGGSSGGSAVAVAAGLAFAALGTDTACSIRHPAHACGVVGFKPSMGLVSTAGVQPLVRTMDHVGALARSVADAALVTAAIAGPDPADVYSCNVDMEKLVDGSDGVAGIRLGVIRPFFFDGDSAIMAVVDRAIERLEQSGATLVPIDGSGLDESLELSRIIFAEAYAIYADELERNRDNFSPELTRKLRRKSEIGAAHYIDAQHRRLLFRTHLEGLMRQCDVLVAPTATLLPAPIDDRPQDYDDHASRNATVFNLGGQPSVSIPCGFSATGLPVGLMISGRLNRDMNLLGIASRIEGCLAVKATPQEPFTANG
jgi:aspartyl-tRNA(Asn)/glutamyl-tRNA(Gln) amidotransferase subunit A